MLKAAPPPLDELKQQAADLVDQLIAKGKPALKLKPAATSRSTGAHGPATAFSPPPPTLRLCWPGSTVMP